jgi:hypothetical protein
MRELTLAQGIATILCGLWLCGCPRTSFFLIGL